MTREVRSNPFKLEEAALRSNIQIEASAGTGKTYTLERIVTHLVEAEGLRIPQILLITFTNKAANELRERIRQRLHTRLRESEEQGEKGPRRENLLRALSEFPQATISTIHSFFQSTLERFSLEIGLNPSELELDFKPLLQPLLYELSLGNLEPADLENYQAALHLPPIKSVEGFLQYCCDPRLLGFWREHPDFSLFPGPNEIEQLSRLKAEFDRGTGPLHNSWTALRQVSWPEEMFQRHQAGRKVLKNRPPKYTPQDCCDFFTRLRSVSSAEELLTLLWRDRPPSPAQSPKPFYIEALAQLSESRIADQPFELLESWPYRDRIDLVNSFLACLGPFYDAARPENPLYQYTQANALLLSLRRRISPKLRLQHQNLGIRVFDDMVEILYRILVLDSQRETSQNLQANLRQKYSIALIDEFQDTDPIQWQILEKIFGGGTRPAGNEPSARTYNYILVGDPKQSIYRFRGASGGLYAKIKEGADYCYSLQKNFRSTPQLISACNRLFANIWESDVFEPVEPGGDRAQPIRQLGSDGTSSRLAAIDFLPIRQYNLTLKEGRKKILQSFAEKISELLSGSFQFEDGTPVQPGDIGVLLPNTSNCRDLHETLQKRGIPALLNEEESLFADSSAEALLFFLLAMLEPHTQDYARRLLLSPLFDLSAADLTALDQTDFWDSFTHGLLQWREWTDRGRLTEALNQLFGCGRRVNTALMQTGLPGRAELDEDPFYRILLKKNAAAKSPEQSHINLRHLIEVLSDEQDSKNLDTSELYIFLNREIKKHQTPARYGGPPVLPGDYQQRLGCDDQAVKIMTVHKSKGLEFPIVFLAFGLKNDLYYKARPESENFLLFDEIGYGSSGELHVRKYAHTSFQNDSVLRFNQELSAEQRRLFYVGLTRAVSKLYLPLVESFKRENVYTSLLQEALGLARPIIERESRWNGPETLLIHLFPSIAAEPAGSAAIEIPEAVRRLASENPECFALSPKSSPLPARSPEENRLEKAQTLPDRQAPPGKKARLFPNRETLTERFPQINSFSSLQRNLSGTEPEPVTEKTGEEPDSSPKNEDDYFSESLISLQNDELQQEKPLDWSHELLLSPGAELGIFLHDILEKLGGESLGKDCGEPLGYRFIARSSVSDLYRSDPFYRAVQSLPSRQSFSTHWFKRAYPAICRMLWHTLHTELPETSGLKLCDLSKAERRHEIEFLLQVPADREFSIDSASGPLTLQKGFLKGFIDLLFTHKGRLYLLDWKSNLSPLTQDYLQKRPSSFSEAALQTMQTELYSRDNLKRIMRSHSYHLQYTLYLAACYQYLKIYLGRDFEYDRDFGGAFYLFLRGVHVSPKIPKGQGVYFSKPAEETIQRISGTLGSQ